jgi:tetratricopeptide (TPR) repeat protein
MSVQLGTEGVATRDDYCGHDLTKQLPRLSRETIGVIIEQIGFESTQNLTMSSRVIKPLVTEAASNTQLKEIKQFIRKLINQLSKEQPSLIELKELLCAMLASLEDARLEHPPFPPLFHLKKHFVSMKEDLIVVLMALNSMTLGSLSRFTPPKFFEDIFILINIRKEIERINRFPDRPGEILGETLIVSLIIDDLVDRKKLSAAEALFEKIESQSIKDKLNYRMAEICIEQRKLEDANLMANRIQNSVLRMDLKLQVVLALIEEGDFDRARTMSKVLVDQNKIVIVEKRMIQRLAEMGKCLEAYERSIKNLDKDNQMDVALNIIAGFTKCGEVDRAEAIALKLPENQPFDRTEGYFGCTKSSGISQIAYALVEAGKVDEGIAFARRWNSGALLTENFQKMASILIEQKKYEQAEAFARAQLFGSDQTFVVFSVLVFTNRIEDAIRIVDQTDDPTFKTYLVDSVIEDLNESEKYQEGLQLVQLLPNSLEKTKKISFALRMLGRVDDALKLASDIEPGEIKDDLLRELCPMLIHLNRFEEAFTLVETIQTVAQQDIAWGDVATACAKIGEFDRALEAAHKISDRSLSKKEAIHSIIKTTSLT